MLDTKAIRERVNRTMPGPWYYEEDEYSWDLYAHGNEMFSPKLIKSPKKSKEYAEYWPNTNDADFIAAARTDVPLLLNEVERYRRGLEFIVNNYSPVPNADYVPVEMLFEVTFIASKLLKGEW